MPIKLEENPESDLLVVHLSGKLSRGDYSSFVPVADRFIAAHRPTRIILDLGDLRGCEIGAAWDDFKFGIRHYSDMSRIAVMGDKRWERWMAALSRPFTRAKVQCFQTAEVDAAQTWVLS